MAVSSISRGVSYAFVGEGGALDAGVLGHVADGVARLYTGVRYVYVPVAELRLADEVTVEEWLGLA
ncbi:hypothetical protein I5H03_gp014 [Mycobacterium phage Nibb]|uniref:Uncharacterized protein n=1 Tax=Mycobacterium phage Nibb TaxID=2510585 RepID=A0A411B5J2_9CAUD|nr:hypothetical protein I5H03_gp014 [Mycobacterium phage Nibb]QAX95632.1 hypothetical protein SEA_NIBB_93 [Mycobacterium phage Nibb]